MPTPVSSRVPLLLGLVLVVTTIMLGFLLLRSEPSAPGPTPGAGPGAAPGGASGTQPAASRPATQPGKAKSLMVYCAAGLKPPVAAIAQAYTREYGTRIDLQYGGSGTLLSSIKVSGQGDLFVAADTSYTDIARKDLVADEVVALAKQTPVIAVKKGNPRGIRSLADLRKPDVRTAIANPDAASIGRITKEMLTKAGAWDALDKAVRERGVFKPTVNDIAADVKLGTVDAAIIWDAMVSQPDYRDALEPVVIENADAWSQDVVVTVLRSSPDPTAALHFARYLAARDRGAGEFEKLGYHAVEADAWADRPRLVIYGGAVTRVGSEEVLRRFARREGVEITTVYNGCGVLNGQIKLGERPDLYHTCDASFMEGVDEHFLPKIEFSSMRLVIAVPATNPGGVLGADELGKPGLKVGVANEKQAALGALTANYLRKHDLYEKVNKNVVVNTPTGDLLVQQVVTGSLDAAIVYKANTAKLRDKLGVIELDGDGSEAVQTLAIGRGTKFPVLTRRLVEALDSPSSREMLEAAGFRPAR